MHQENVQDFQGAIVGSAWPWSGCCNLGVGLYRSTKGLPAGVPSQGPGISLVPGFTQEGRQQELTCLSSGYSADRVSARAGLPPKASKKRSSSAATQHCVGELYWQRTH